MIRRTPLRGRRMRVSEALTGQRPVPRISRATQRKRDILTNDGLFRRLILLRDHETCQYPGCGRCGKGIQTAHVFTRSRLAVRWREENALCLCGGHHIFWAHKHPMQFQAFIQHRLGDAVFQQLVARSESSGKGVDLAAVRLWLVERIKEMEAGRVAEG